MPVLKGSNTNPGIVDSPLDRTEIQAKGSTEEKARLEEKMVQWKVFSNTRVGRVVMELADPMIKYYMGQLSCHVHRFSDAAIAEQYRAECRGALGVWQLIKYEPETLKKLLGELQGQEKKEKDEETDKKLENIFEKS